MQQDLQSKPWEWEKAQTISDHQNLQSNFQKSFGSKPYFNKNYPVKCKITFKQKTTLKLACWALSYFHFLFLRQTKKRNQRAALNHMSYYILLITGALLFLEINSLVRPPPREPYNLFKLGSTIWSCRTVWD